MVGRIVPRSVCRALVSLALLAAPLPLIGAGDAAPSAGLSGFRTTSSARATIAGRAVTIEIGVYRTPIVIDPLLPPPYQPAMAYVNIVSRDRRGLPPLSRITARVQSGVSVANVTFVPAATALVADSSTSVWTASLPQLNPGNVRVDLAVQSDRKSTTVKFSNVPVVSIF